MIQLVQLVFYSLNEFNLSNNSKLIQDKEGTNMFLNSCPKSHKVLHTNNVKQLDIAYYSNDRVKKHRAYLK